MKLKVVAYCRVSTDKDGQIESYDNQIEMAMEKIRKNPDWEFAGIYADPAFTGTNADRPEFQRMMADARRQKFDIILVKSISRFARNTMLTIQTLQELKELGISVQFEKERIDTGAPYSEMLLTIMSAFAQEESRNISERVKKGLRMRAMNGQVCWTPMYGYTKEDGVEYIIVPKEAEIIRRIYDEYERGEQQIDIVKRLNEDGYPSPGGQAWQRRNIREIITNPKYMGDILTGKTYTVDHMSHKKATNHGEVERHLIEKHHEGIVSKEQYNRVQEILQMRTRNQYPFEGKLICPACGRPLKKDCPNGRLSYWCCPEDRLFILLEKVESAVLHAYKQMDPGTDEILQKLKAEYPTMERADLWWMNRAVDTILLGDHFKDKSSTLTVVWRNGTETTVPTHARKVRGNKKKTQEKVRQPERGARTVRKISAEK